MVGELEKWPVVIAGPVQDEWRGRGNSVVLKPDPCPWRRLSCAPGPGGSTVPCQWDNLDGRPVILVFTRLIQSGRHAKASRVP